MKRMFALLLSALMLVSAVPFAVTASAAEKTVYVSATGSDSAAGTESAPFATLGAAIQAMADGGTVVIIDSVSLTGSSTAQYVEPTHSGKVTVTGKPGAVLTLQGGMVYALAGETEFNNLKINTGSGYTEITARFNTLTMGEGLTMTGSNLWLIGGYDTPAAGTPTALNSNITVKSGTYGYIVGFSRNKGPSTRTYTGTSNITVYNGKINKIYCASHANHYSGSTNVKIYGGTISSLCAGGDMTRRLNGTSNFEIYGGTVSSLELNNACGDTTIKLDGGSVKKLTESIYGDNAEITKLSSTAVRSLSYNSLNFDKAAVEKLCGSIIDKLSVYGDVYLKEGATGTGTSAESPTGDLKAAIEKLGQAGGSIRVVGNYNLKSNFVESAHTGEITVEGDGKLVFASGVTYTLGGPTDFAVATENATVIGGDNALRFTADYTSDGKTVATGANLHVAGGSFAKIVATGNAYLELSGGKIDSVKATESGETENSVSFALIGAEVEKADLCGVRGSLTVSCQSGKLGAITAGTTGALVSGAKYSLTYATSFDAALFASILPLFSVSDEKVLYACDAGTGNGFTAATATTLKNAFVALQTTGGTVVIIGETTVKSTSLQACDKPVTVTSVYGTTDYRTSGAKLVLAGSVTFHSDVLLENLNMVQDVSAPTINFDGKNATIGGGISVEKPAAFDYYPTITGRNASGTGFTYCITVESGHFGYLFGTTNTTTNKCNDFNVTININGGEFQRIVSPCGAGAFTGDVTLNVNGGKLTAGIYGVSNEAGSCNGNVTVNLNGGTVIGSVAPAYSKNSSLNGTYTVAVNGGEFAGVTEIVGTDGYVGRMTSKITYGANVNIYAEETGTHTYMNPVTMAADPWVIFKDGYYYMTKTAGTSIGVAKATNIGDLANAPLITVFKPATGKEYSKSLWSPELHYYKASDFPNGDFSDADEGWYILLACDDGDNANHRMYVLKSLDGDPQGQYGNPVTKVANVPQKIVSDTDPTVGQVWACGQTDGVINGELYCFWVSEIYEGTTLRYQTLNVSKMKNPWTLTGKCSVVCKPTMDWEKHGATYGIADDGKIHPEVVEGIATFTTPSGEVYMLYCGSGYWTEYYCLGQLKLVGDDPTDYDSWYKYPQPVLTKSNDFNGTGHCCYTVSPDGKTNLIIYHGYLGAVKSGNRYMIVETYTVGDNGITIGNGTKKTSPADTVFTLANNPMPLVKKIGGFDEGNPTFLQYNTTVALNEVANLTPTLASGATYDAASYGTVSYTYHPKGETGNTAGLPNAVGTYVVTATLAGVNSYSGISTTFELTITENAVATTEAPATTDSTSADSGDTSPVLYIVLGAAALAVAVVVFVISKKKH